MAREGPLALRPPDKAMVWSRALRVKTVCLRELNRVSERKFPSVVHFGKAGCNRFDDPKGEYGVLYAGSDYLTCVVESVLRDAVRTGARPLYVGDLTARVYAMLAPTSTEVNLVDLTLALGLGLDNQIATTPDYAITQAWSRAFYEHPSQPDGLYYVSRNYPNGKVFALFDRVLKRTRVVEAPSSRVGLRVAEDYPRLLQLLEEQGLALKRGTPAPP